MLDPKLWSKQTIHKSHLLNAKITIQRVIDDMGRHQLYLRESDQEGPILALDSREGIEELARSLAALEYLQDVSIEYPVSREEREKILEYKSIGYNVMQLADDLFRDYAFGSGKIDYHSWVSLVEDIYYKSLSDNRDYRKKYMQLRSKIRKFLSTNSEDLSDLKQDLQQILDTNPIEGEI